MDAFDLYIVNLKKNNDFVDVYRDGIAGGPLFGHVLWVNEVFLAIKCFDDNGIYDGFSIIRKSDISRLRVGGNELKSIKNLILAKHNPSLIHIPENDVFLLEKSKNFEEVFNGLKKYNFFTIYIEQIDQDISFIGEIKQSDQKIIILNAYGTKKGLDHSELLLRLEDITRVDIDTTYMNDIYYVNPLKPKRSGN